MHAFLLHAISLSQLVNLDAIFNVQAFTLIYNYICSASCNLPYSKCKVYIAEPRIDHDYWPRYARQRARRPAASYHAVQMTSCLLMGRGGTTQGDPLAMTMYAIDTVHVPLIHQPDACILTSVGQVWFVDHATAGGKLSI